MVYDIAHRKEPRVKSRMLKAREKHGEGNECWLGKIHHESWSPLGQKKKPQETLGTQDTTLQQWPCPLHQNKKLSLGAG
ncbi:hypothetical protein QC762_104335 [Podospora pseudocomata]|uniref:Uncharacterized protein n=1 Tax=Podospora pseudocomata TaxID=2093779 RepID=A0ABR0GSL6_9PEZI|nr:hypothetical protein QC762_104335 [Podospora pseudocomata]